MFRGRRCGWSNRGAVSSRGAGADWYLAQVCAGGMLALDVLFEHAAGDLDAQLVAEDGAVLVHATSTDDDEQIAFQVSPELAMGQRLFVRVYGAAGARAVVAVGGACAGDRPRATRSLMTRDDRQPATVLPAWDLAGAVLAELPSGHINRTWRVDPAGGGPGGRFVLQWLNPIFAPEVHHDIEAVTARLAAAGLATPRLVPTRAGALWTTDPEGGVWRLFTFVPGETRLTADTPQRCAAAGALLGAFHGALWDFEHTYRFGRLGVHDTPAHLATLARALDSHADHPSLPAVAPVAAAILAHAAGLPLDLGLPLRHVHGDPKISNVRFAEDGRAVCLVDLDTLARMPLAVELGDAFRSWCSPAGEEVDAPFRLDFFEAGLAGYAAGLGGRAAPEEREAVPLLVETIALELAARFCADALRESYFGWDRRRFPNASAHNLLRARSQLALARSVRDHRPALEALVRRVWR